MRKIILILITLFILIFIVSWYINPSPDDKKYCEVNSDCAYSDDAGTECVNKKYGKPGVVIYDWPSCVCNKNQCELEPCDNPPCELG